MNLNNLIKSRVGPDLNRVALVGVKGAISFADLLRSSTNLNGGKVVVFVADTVNLVRTLISLDGVVQSICPISTAISKEELKHLVGKNKFDVVITDQSDNDLEIFSDLRMPTFKTTDVIHQEKIRTKPKAQETAWLVPTSGTTLMPKLVNHSLASLAASSIRERGSHKKGEIWGQFYDVTRYAGYQTLFNSLLNGHTLITSPPEEALRERIARCAEECVTHISATPSLWRKILMIGEDARRLPLEQIVLGGEAADQQILDALRRFYPKAKITHTFASTEAGLGFSVSDCLAGFPISFINNSDGLAEISIRNDRLFLRSSSGANSYVDGVKIKSPEGWVDTGDIVTIHDDRFFVIGRESGIINIGGDKVNPEAIRQSLLQHPDVIQATVFGKKNPITGMVLCANIQLHADVNEESASASVRMFIKNNLQSKDQPRMLKFVEDIEVALSGKLVRGR